MPRHTGNTVKFKGVRLRTHDNHKTLGGKSIESLGPEYKWVAPDYAGQLAYEGLPSGEVGRALSMYDRSLMAIGARAHKVGQLVLPPAVRPQLTYAKETDGWIRMVDFRSLPGRASSSVIQYEIKVSGDQVVARLPKDTFQDNLTSPEEFRQFFGLQPDGEHIEPSYDVSLAQAPDPSARFVTKIEDLNRYDLRLLVGEITIL